MRLHKFFLEPSWLLDLLLAGEGPEAMRVAVTLPLCHNLSVVGLATHPVAATCTRDTCTAQQVHLHCPAGALALPPRLRVITF